MCDEIKPNDKETYQEKEDREKERLEEMKWELEKEDAYDKRQREDALAFAKREREYEL